MENEKKVCVPAVERAIDILEYIAENPEGKTIAEICQALKIPLASAFRTTKYLVGRGYLRENNHLPCRYRLGFQVLKISNALLNGVSLYSAAKKSMPRVVQITNQAVQLGILQGAMVTYIEQMLPKTPVNIIAPVHMPIALNSSASGKVILANKSREEQMQLLDSIEYEVRTEKSIRNREQMLLELKKVKLCGYAMDDEEYALGIGCLAAPIFDSEGECVGALGITGEIKGYHNPETKKLFLECIQEEAVCISKRLGWQEKKEERV